MESGWRSGLYPWIRWGILVFFLLGSGWTSWCLCGFFFYRFSCPFQVLTEPSFMPAVVVPGFDKNSLKDAPVKFSPGSAYQGEFVRNPPFFWLFNSIDLLENQESLTVFYWRERATALQDGAHVVNLENKSNTKTIRHEDSPKHIEADGWLCGCWWLGGLLNHSCVFGWTILY